jgi:uncharacterized protein (TIGR00251 family)
VNAMCRRVQAASSVPAAKGPAVTRPTDLYDVERDAVVVRLHVQPGAGRSSIVGRHGDSLKVRVAAPPVDGRANAAAIALIAATLGVKESAVELVSGERSRLKRLRVVGIDADDVESRLRQALAEAESRVGEPRHRPV